MFDLKARAALGIARWVWALIMLVIIIMLIAGAIHLITARPKAEARLGKNTAEAALHSGSDAVATVGQVGARDQTADDLTRRNADDIAHARGADAPVDPAARDAGLRSLCKRAAYRGSAKCLQLAPAP